MKDFKNKTKAESIKDLEDKTISLRDLRFNLSGSKTKDVKERFNIRKSIARIKTALKNS